MVSPRQRILSEVWRRSYVDEQTVDLDLSCLRRKLGECAAQPRFLHTVRGVGVKLVWPSVRGLLAGVALAVTSTAVLAFLIPLALLTQTQLRGQAIARGR